jgi:hypothetical protein
MTINEKTTYNAFVFLKIVSQVKRSSYVKGENIVVDQPKFMK